MLRLYAHVVVPAPDQILSYHDLLAYVILFCPVHLEAHILKVTVLPFPESFSYHAVHVHRCNCYSWNIVVSLKYHNEVVIFTENHQLFSFQNSIRLDVLRYRNHCLHLHALNQLTYTICFQTTVPPCYPIFISRPATIHPAQVSPLPISANYYLSPTGNNSIISFTIQFFSVTFAL